MAAKALLRAPIVLIVDDEPELREMLADAFKAGGFEVFESGSGGDAKEIISRQPIDAMVSDLRMPGGGGIELLEWFKSRGGPIPPVILISGYSELSDDSLAELGAKGMFHKPFNMKEIVAKVRGLLTRFEP